MRSTRERVRQHAVKCLAVPALAGVLTVAGTWHAGAQNASAMSCGALWQERNAIYARNGYCFQTPRAIAVFGRGCFAPFGKLYGPEANRVSELQSWERQRGC